MLPINTFSFPGIAHLNIKNITRLSGSKTCGSVAMIAIGITGLFPLPLFAVPTSSDTDIPLFERADIALSDDEDTTAEDNYSWADQTNDYLSNLVLDFSEYIDHGLAKDEDEEPLTNKSYIKLRTSSEYSHRGYYDDDQRISVRIDLPHTEHDWKIILETDPDDYDDLESKQRGQSSSNSDKNGAFGGIRLEDEQISHWKTSFDIGIKLRLPLDPFTRAEIRRVGKLSDDWSGEFKQEFFYYNTKGLGSLTELNFYLDVDEGEIFKIGSSAQYLYDDDKWEVLHQAQYFDRLDEKNLMQYSVGISLLPYDNDVVSNYWLSASWYRKLYKNWLFLTVTPQLEFPSEYDYKFNPGIFIELEAFFSKNREENLLNRSIPDPTSTSD